MSQVIYTCDRCGVVHHAEGGVMAADGYLLCRNTEQCARRLGPEYSPAKAVGLSVGDETARVLLPRGSRAIYTTPGGLLFCIGIRPPSYPVGVTWLKYTVQRYVKKPKVLWCGVDATTIKLFFK
jgi:hypothetical protein